MKLFHKHKWEFERTFLYKYFWVDHNYKIYCCAICGKRKVEYDYIVHDLTKEQLLDNLNIFLGIDLVTQPKPKVYCENCEWYKKTDESLMAQPKFQCFHPDNSCDNYESPKLLPVYLASRINANNDCSWYEPKLKNEHSVVTAWHLEKNDAVTIKFNKVYKANPKSKPIRVRPVNRG